MTDQKPKLTLNTDKPKDDGLVTVRITKKGDGKVSTGKRENNQDVYFAWKDTVKTTLASGEALEARGFGEIDG